MTAASVDIAESIKDLINAAAAADEFSFHFTAVRAYVPNFVLENTTPSGLEVYVSPARHSVSKDPRRGATRGTNVRQCGIAISVINKPPDRSNESLDPLVDLVEQIQVKLCGKIVVGTVSANTEISDQPLFRPEQLIESAGLFWGAFVLDVYLARDS